MISFIFTAVFMLSLACVLYLMVRALPRVAEETTPGDHQGLLDRWAHSELPEKIDATVNGFLFKFFRKTRVTVLKLDNALGDRLQKMKPEDTNGKQVIDFKEIASKAESSEVSKV